MYWTWYIACIVSLPHLVDLPPLVHLHPPLLYTCTPPLLYTYTPPLLYTLPPACYTQAKSTGQLSIITAFMNFGGSVARIFTSLQENVGGAMVQGYIIGMYRVGCGGGVGVDVKKVGGCRCVDVGIICVLLFRLLLIIIDLVLCTIHIVTPCSYHLCRPCPTIFPSQNTGALLNFTVFAQILLYGGSKGKAKPKGKRGASAASKKTR